MQLGELETLAFRPLAKMMANEICFYRKGLVQVEYLLSMPRGNHIQNH